MLIIHQLLDCPVSLLVSEGEREGPGIDTSTEEEPGPDGAAGMVDCNTPTRQFSLAGG